MRRIAWVLPGRNKERVAIAFPRANEIRVLYPGARQTNDACHQPIAMCAALLQAIKVAGVRHNHDRVALDAHTSQDLAQRGRVKILGTRSGTWRREPIGYGGMGCAQTRHAPEDVALLDLRGSFNRGE